jgi:hypothetical protein
MQVLKWEMKPTQVHGIYLTKDQHLQGGDWLVKDLEAVTPTFYKDKNFFVQILVHIKS